MDDQSILEHVTALVEEERQLRASAPAPGANADRLQHIEEQLDQCWDLLRQRRAQREYGGDADDASVRDVKTVEGYQRGSP